MPFETRPFDLGNTLARAAQINLLRNRNELAQLNLQNQRGITNELAEGGTDFRQFGQQGLEVERQLGQLSGEK